MKQSVKILTQNCCEELLAFSSKSDLRQKYNEDKYDTSVLEFVRIPTKYFIDDIVTLGTTPKDDCQSSITVFTELSRLDKVQANDKRLWSYLTHTIFFGYTRKRWGIDSDSTEATITSRFHFEGAGIEARMRNAISRLWWTAKVTYDEGSDDPFELTKLIWEKQDIHVAIMERSFAAYPNLIKGFLEFYKINKQLKEDDLRAILRGVNAIGGVKVLPILTKEEIVEEIKRISDFNKVQIS